MMVTYDSAKEKMESLMGKDQPLKVQFCSSMIAGINIALISLPFDNIKTKLQKQKPLPDGTLMYKNL